MIEKALIAKIDSIKDRVVQLFDAGDWILLENYLDGAGSIISEHPRLLRSLNFGDEDYPACVAEVLGKIYKAEPDAMGLVESMLDKKGAAATGQQSSLSSFAAATNGAEVDTSLATAMMPFDPSFAYVRQAIDAACSKIGLTLKAADDIWDDSILINDVFNLISKACIVVVDFTDKNPNVMYETGVAHALGKEVIPISQSIGDVPFDLKHHRILIYKSDATGLVILQNELEKRIKTIMDHHGWFYMPF